MVGLSHSIGVECWARLSTRYGPGCECAGELLKMSLVLLLCNAAMHVYSRSLFNCTGLPWRLGPARESLEYHEMCRCAMSSSAILSCFRWIQRQLMVLRLGCVSFSYAEWACSMLCFDPVDSFRWFHVWCSWWVLHSCYAKTLPRRMWSL